MSKLIKHHIAQRTHWGSNHPQNLHARTIEFERAYHTIFPCMLPIDRIQKILDLDSQVYNPEVVQEVNKVIEQVRKDWIDAYDYRCFRWNNVFTKKND